MDKEELNKKLKEFDKDFVSVHIGDFEVIKIIHKRIIGYSKSGMSLEKIYEGFKAKEIIKNISFSAFKKEVRKLKTVQKDGSKSSLVRVKNVAEEVPLVAQVVVKKSIKDIDLNCVQSMGFKKALIETSSEQLVSSWINNADNLDNNDRYKLSKALDYIPSPKRTGELYKFLFEISKQ